MSEMKEKMHTGELYLPGDEEIMKEQVIYQDKLCDYNMTKPSESEKRMKMLKDMLGDCGEGVYIEAPFYANFGGHHCHFGKMVYANYHLTCVDDTHVVAVGNPCRIMREIGERDKEYYYKDRKIAIME